MKDMSEVLVPLRKGTKTAADNAPSGPLDKGIAKLVDIQPIPPPF